MITTTDFSGQRFGRLLVLERVGSKNNRTIWRSQCDCGNIIETSLQHIVDGHVRSCGCLRKENSRLLAQKIHSEHKEYHKEFGVSCRNHLYTQYRKGAKQKGREFSLTVEQFAQLTSAKCYYCGLSPNKIFRRKGMYGEYKYNGIDRVDNTKGYSIENCVPCCWECNKAKLDRDYTEFVNWISRLVKHWGGE